MKPILLILALLALHAVFTTALFAAPPKTVTVTVTVEGFHCQGCPDALAKDLAKLPGVTEVKATLKPAQVTAKLDESKTSAAAFTTAIANHPRLMDAQKTYGAKLQVYVNCQMATTDKTQCAACKAELVKTLTAVKGVSAVTLDEACKVISVSFAKDAKVTTDALTKALTADKMHVTPSYTAPAAKADTGHAAAGNAGGGCAGGVCPMSGK